MVFSEYLCLHYDSIYLFFCVVYVLKITTLIVSSRRTFLINIYEFCDEFHQYRAIKTFLSIIVCWVITLKFISPIVLIW